MPALDICSQNPNINFAHTLLTRNIDPRIQQDTAVISGEDKGWRGRLIRLTDTTATIECAGGRQQPEITGPLKNFVLM